VLAERIGRRSKSGWAIHCSCVYWPQALFFGGTRPLDERNNLFDHGLACCCELQVHFAAITVATHTLYN
jgi:hypothetical protein